MKSYFRNVNVDLGMNRGIKYNDFRDWFIINENKIYETKILFFINDKFIYEDMMPINTKIIDYKISSGVNYETTVKRLKWMIPEMEIEKETVFSKPMIITHFDSFNVEGTIQLNIV